MAAVRLHALAFVAALGLATATTAQAQHKGARGNITTPSATRRGEGASENIKHEELVNSKTATAMPAPASKGGAKTRGAATLDMHVDNRTPWYIRIYVDGDFNGAVGPYGDVYAYIPCDDHIMYAEARFDDGTVRTWGPSLVNTCSSDTVWHLGM